MLTHEDRKPITGIFLSAPSIIEVGEPFALGIKMLCNPFFVERSPFDPVPSVGSLFNRSPRGITYMDNVPQEWDGVISIEGGDDYDGPKQYSFTNGSGPYQDDRRPIRRIQGLSFSRPGVKFITVREPESGVVAISNPIEVRREAPVERLFWGDIHCHSFFSDGLRCPEELYAFARDEAFLDIFGMADHSESLTDRQWEYFVNVTNDYNEAGKFATLVGFEWTNHRLGHRNVHFRGDRGPIWRSKDPGMGELPNLYAAAREHGALVIPHHPANAPMGVDWSQGHDPEVERLVEVNSIWGNSECPASQGNPRPIRFEGGEKAGQHVIDGLNHGYQLGFIGGGDTHDGRPGDELHHLQKRPESYRLLRRQGIMAVRAKALTREAIFDALWNRSCYATSNIRPLLELEINGAPMGSTIEAKGKVTMVVKAASEVSISRVILVKNGQDLSVRDVGRQVVEEQFSDHLDKEPTWLYARIERVDGEMAWSSPIWING